MELSLGFHYGTTGSVEAIPNLLRDNRGFIWHCLVRYFSPIGYAKDWANSLL